MKNLLNQSSDVVTIFKILVLILSTTWTNCQAIWVGGTIGQETNWNEPNNWDKHRLPNAMDDVLIPAQEYDNMYYPTLQRSVVKIGRLTIQKGASCRIDDNACLMIDGSFMYDHGVVNLGLFEVYGNLSIKNVGVMPISNDGGIIKAHCKYINAYNASKNASKHIQLISDEQMNHYILVTNEINELKPKIESNFKAYKYAEVRRNMSRYFDIVKGNEVDYLKIKYLYSKTCFGMEDYSLALETLNKLLSNKNLDIRLRHEAEFDLALISLMTNQKSSIDLFSSIAVNYDSPYHRDAKSIVDGY